MSSALVVRALEAGTYEWIRGGGDAASVERGDARALAAAAESHPVSLLVDGRDVRTLEASIPARSLRQAQQAAPFAIEDEVADDIEDLHVECGAALTGGKRNVAVIRRQAVEALVEPVRAAGVTIAELVPDYLALPYRAGHWSILHEHGRVLVRTAEQQGFSCDEELFAALLARADGQSLPAGLEVFGDSTLPDVLARLPLQRHPLPGAPLGLLAKGCADPQRIDILPVEYRSRQLGMTGGLRLAAALLLLALATHIGFLWNDVRQARAGLAAVRSAQATTMQGAFPELPRIVNAEVQATQAVAELRAGQRRTLGALELIHHLGQGLHDAGGTTLALENLNYADGIVSVRMSAPDIASLERYSESLKPKVDVEVVAVEARDDRVGGSLRVQPLAESVR